LSAQNFTNATSVETNCDDDPCDYVVVRKATDDGYYDEMGIVNECIQYNDSMSAEYMCSDDGVNFTIYGGDDCFGSGEILSETLEIAANGSLNVTHCDDWSIDCQSDAAQECAHCLTYGPCLNSVDPHCITHDALDCLPCEDFAVCSPCAPGWDEMCIATEFHEDYGCTSPDLTRESDNYSIPIPWRLDGNCQHHEIFEGYYMGNCSDGEMYYECNDDCSSCNSSMNGTFDVQIDYIENGVCFNFSTFDEDDNETRYESWNVYGHCSADHMNPVNYCPDGQHCGPDPCNLDDNDYCIEIEIFDENSTCNATRGAGDYTAFVIADNMCRMDGSGRSYYALECSNGTFKGVIGCLDCACSVNCTDIVAANEGADGLDGYEPFTCYQYNVTDSLQMAGIINETNGMCSQMPTERTYMHDCADAPTNPPDSKGSKSASDSSDDNSTVIVVESTEDSASDSSDPEGDGSSRMCVDVTTVIAVVLAIEYFR